MVDVPALFDLLLGYMCFGLALYAGCALVAALWIRQHSLFSRPVLSQLWVAYASVVLLILIETAQQLWEHFQTGRTPRVILHLALPLIYLILGNSAFRLARHELAEEMQKVRLEEWEAPRTVVKSARP